MKNPCRQLYVLLASCLWLSIHAVAAQAEREIVYAARYFYSPHNRRISHYHIYRINPDGTGRIALTSGNRDDYGPVWSPDGKQILFLRAYFKANDYIRSLCVVAAEGGTVRTLLKSASREMGQYGWSPDGRWLAYALPKQLPEGGYYLPSSQIVLTNVITGKTLTIPSAAAFTWSPDSRRMLVWHLFSSGDLHMRVIEPDSGKTTPLGTQLYDPVWLDNRTWIGIDVHAWAQAPTLNIVSQEGHELRTIQPQLPASGDYQTASRLAPIPTDPTHVALGFKYGRTAWTWYRVDLQTKAATCLPISDGITWSPDLRWFCGAPERALAPYGEGHEFIAPLYLYTSSGKRIRNLTSGTVYTEGADWHRSAKRQGKARIAKANPVRSGSPTCRSVQCRRAN